MKGVYDDKEVSQMTAAHLNTCSNLTSVLNLPQVRLSMLSSYQNIGQTVPVVKRKRLSHNNLFCKFCFKSFELTGEEEMFCSLCRRKLEIPEKRNRNKNITKSKVEKEVEVKPKKKKKKSKKDPTAGLCLTGKTGDEDEMKPRQALITTSSMSKLLQSNKPRDKNKLKFLLDNKSEKKTNRLDDFFKLLE